MSDVLAPRIGVFGGSGFYEFLKQAQDIVVETPFGPTSSPVSVAQIAGHDVAFIARHGREHSHAAHRVPYRANVWAMHSLGVRSIIAPCSVGSLQPDIHPGQLVVVDQLVDRTWGRPDTFHDVGGPLVEPGSRGGVHHQEFAEPFDGSLGSALLEAGDRTGSNMVAGGTIVVINGPRFSTRAESAWYRAAGWHVVNMTCYPEAVLAAELSLRYASIALVTDYDAGVDGHPPVTMDAVFAMIKSNVSRVQGLIVDAIEHDFEAISDVQ